MKVEFNKGAVVLRPESAADREDLSTWGNNAVGRVFLLDHASGNGGALIDLGAREDACREPINIVFGEGPSPWQPISNLANTPFHMGTTSYASVEGFWQGLKFDAPADRARVARLWGIEAKRAAQGRPDRPSFIYDGRTISAGSAEHRQLMLQACRAKFAQNLEAREALLETGLRPLTHLTQKDSKIIPGVLMADMWMRVRAALRSKSGGMGK